MFPKLDFGHFGCGYRHDNTIKPFWFPGVGRKKLTAAFDGGVMLLTAAERRIGIAHRLAALIADPRNPLLVTHSVVDILRARMLALTCSCEDADDLDHLLHASPWSSA